MGKFSKQKKCQKCKRNITNCGNKQERHHYFCEPCWIKHKEKLNNKPRINENWNIIEVRKKQRDKSLEDLNLLWKIN